MTVLTLEDFCPSAPVSAPPPPPERGYDEGYTAGLSAGMASAGDEKQQALGEVLQTLTDLSIGYEEAKQAVLAALGPLFEALTDVLMPEMARAGLTRTIVTRLTDAARADAEQGLSLHIPPTLAGEIEAPLAGLGSSGVALEIDPSLTPGQAILRAGQEETVLDIDAACAEIRNLIDTLMVSEERQTTHG